VNAGDGWSDDDKQMMLLDIALHATLLRLPMSRNPRTCGVSLLRRTARRFFQNIDAGRFRLPAPGRFAVAKIGEVIVIHHAGIRGFCVFRGFFLMFGALAWQGFHAADAF